MRLDPAATLCVTDLLADADQAAREGQFDQARELYARVLEDDPESLDAQVGLDYMSYLMGSFSSRYGWGERKQDEQLQASRESNLRLLEKEFEEKRIRLRSLPISILIEHTTRCNFYCPHCSKGYDPYFAEDMSEEVMNQVVERLLPTMMWACVTGFGEPTISTQYSPLMGKLVSGGVIPHFSTNTSTLTIPHIDALVRARARVILSIDGATKETFETIRAGGKWDRLQYVLHAIRRIRRILGGDSWFDVTFVGMRTNIHELPEMVRMVHRFELDHLKVQDYLAFGVEYDQNTLRNDPEGANSYLDEAERLAEELGVTLYRPPNYETSAPKLSVHRSLWQRIRDTRSLLPTRRRFPQRCKMPWQFANVLMHGEVTPCCNSPRVMGNLTREPIERIWNGWRYRLFRFLVDSPVPPPECRKCHVYEGINQGNPGNTIAKEGFLLKLLYRIHQPISDYWKRRAASSGTPPAPTYYQGKPIRILK